MTTLKIQLVHAGASALKRNAGISDVELVIGRWRAWGCPPSFYAHCLYFCYSLPEKVVGWEKHVLGKEKHPATKDWTGQGSSLQISRPTSDRQTDGLLSQHDLLELSSPSVLRVWVSLASQDLETSDSFIAHFASLLCLILNYHISDFSSLWLTTLSYDRLESLYKYFLF